MISWHAASSAGCHRVARDGQFVTEPSDVLQRRAPSLGLAVVAPVQVVEQHLQFGSKTEDRLATRLEKVAERFTADAPEMERPV